MNWLKRILENERRFLVPAAVLLLLWLCLALLPYLRAWIKGIILRRKIKRLEDALGFRKSYLRHHPEYASIFAKGADSDLSLMQTIALSYRELGEDDHAIYHYGLILENLIEAGAWQRVVSLLSDLETHATDRTSALQAIAQNEMFVRITVQLMEMVERNRLVEGRLPAELRSPKTGAADCAHILNGLLQRARQAPGIGQLAVKQH